MPIALVRIDDRLVHGQVVESWIPYVRADRVAVVSDAAAKDATQQMLMQLALPEHMSLEVLSVEEAPAFVAAAESEAGRLLVLAPGPVEVLALLRGGARFGAVNVGGLHYSAGRVQVGRVIYLCEADRRALEEISALGVRLEGQAVPADAKMDIGALLRESRVG
ncbi:MAG: PTS sugar transporter subunit IIB [Elusimicrobia bacterium]|nr:PTS sugar transporter subunit IIB [Elusimicrobiota bacterium]